MRSCVDVEPSLAKDIGEWAKRFFPLNEFVGVQLNATLFGDDALKTRGISWNEDFVHYEIERTRGSKKLPPTIRFYFEPTAEAMGNQTFSYRRLAEECVRFDLVLSRFTWTFMRSIVRGGLEMAGVRESEFVKIGFGREHPKKSWFTPHPHLLELADFLPGSPLPHPWNGFEPLWIALQHGSFMDTRRNLRLTPVWDTEKMEVTMCIDEEPADTPETIKQIEL